ncbi:MAG: hypothetical protein RSD63_01735 [Eubacterium sp.]
MKVKLCDLKALENITIAAYDIPDNLILASKVKYTKAAGKNNCFISGSPVASIDRDLEVLAVSAHRISCTYSFGMDENGYEDLIKTLMEHPDFTVNEKRNQPEHHVFYINKRKFTISYFKKKGVAMLYASNDLFDNYLTDLFDRQWGERPDPDRKKEKISVTSKTAKPMKIAKSEKTIKTAKPLKKNKLPMVELTTTLPLSEKTREAEKVSNAHPNWTVQDIGFRINRIVVTGEKLSLNAVKTIKNITDKSSNSVSVKIDDRGPGKKKKAITLTSNVNSFMVEAINCMKEETADPISMQIRFPVKTHIWDFISNNNWLDSVKTESLDEGFILKNDNDEISFSHNNATGVCEMYGQDTDLFYNCVTRLDKIFKNNVGDRKVEKESINEVIRKKIPYTIRALKDQADQFINLVSPSFVLLNDPEIELSDYSPMVFSVYRGVELYLKYLADLSGIDLANKSVGKMFKGSSRDKQQSLEIINDSLRGNILQSVFENFSDYRNSLFHANLDNVVIINSRQAAEDICINALQNLEAASFQFHLEEMTILI